MRISISYRKLNKIIKKHDPVENIELLSNLRIYEGGPQKPRIYLLKNCVFILTRLNFSHLQSSLHLMQYTYRDVFLLLKTAFELIDLMPFSVSIIYCFPSSTSAKRFPLRTFLIQGNNKKLLRMRLGE